MLDEEAAALYTAYGDDPELAFAIKMSMLEEEAKNLVIPDEPIASQPGSVNLQFRMPDSSKIQRRFLTSHHIRDVVNFIKKQTG